MEQPLIYNIQRYSIHDGDGIRTTIFFKGCPLRCGWCHNPESQNFLPELLFDTEKCTGCGACAGACTAHAVQLNAEHKAETDREACALCGECLDYCLSSARSIAGRTYEIEELMREAEKDRMFYEQSGGGITLSGGEVMAQPIDYIERLAARLYEKGYSVNIDTCGFAPYERFERILPYTDAFLYDIKEMDSEKHKALTGAGNELILENLRKLSGAGTRIHLRLPLIAGVNADEEHVRSVISFLQSGVGVERIYLLPYHNTGKSKYGRLSRPYDTARLFEVPAREQTERFAEQFRQNGFTKVQIGG